MPFQLPEYLAPDFDAPKFRQAPSARTAPAPRDGIAPEGFHAMSIFPEYFKVGERWLLPEESRMDCVAVPRGDWIDIVEFRRLKAGEPVFVGRARRVQLLRAARSPGRVVGRLPLPMSERASGRSHSLARSCGNHTPASYGGRREERTKTCSLQSDQSSPRKRSANFLSMIYCFKFNFINIFITFVIFFTRISF